MMHTIFEVELPVGETLQIQKNTIQSKDFNKRSKRLSIVSGIHGNELEGQYICYEVARRINENPDKFHGQIDLYPALNPLGIEMGQRLIPEKNLDLNRSFPGDSQGHMVDRLASAIIEDLIGSDMVLDIHASDKFTRELPQVRISSEFEDKLIDYAVQLNVDMVWINEAEVAQHATLAHSMNMFNVPTLVIDLGLGNQVNEEFGNQVVDGIFNLLKNHEMWSGDVESIKFPVISSDGEVTFIRSDIRGIFLPRAEHNHFIKKGDLIGLIIDAYTGRVLEEIIAEESGLIFTLRVSPLVYEGALVARILAMRG